MRPYAISAIFMLFWAFSFFLVLPFRLQSKRDQAADVMIPGQAESAPPSFSFGRTAKWTTVVAVILFGAYYLNYVNGWVPVDWFNFVPDRAIEGN